MINETKRDVLKEALLYVPTDYEYDWAEGKEAGNLAEQLLARYTAALPDDLPVIPEAWGDTIEEFKANHYRLSEIFTEWDWNYDEQELIARAWLLGVWRVEETGEIVKLEEEK
jgi:hypothetical protein